MTKDRIVKIELEKFEEAVTEDYRPGLIEDYWKFKEGEEYEYLHTAKKILEKYDIKSAWQLEALLSKNGRLNLYFQLDCGRCIGKFELYKRSQLLEFTKWGRLFHCKDCRSKEIKLELNEKFLTIQSQIKKLATALAPINDDSLSYLEKIFLFCLINFENLSIQDPYLKRWKHFQEHEARGAEGVIHRLMSKGFVFGDWERYRLGEEVKSANNLLNSGWHFLDEEEFDDLNELLKNLISTAPKPRVFIPKCYSSVKEFSLKLLHDIRNFIPTFNDVVEIEEFVKNKRVSEIKNLYYFICSTRKIPISHSNRKEMVFKIISENFNLNETMNIFSYRARLMQADLYGRLSEENRAYNANYFIKQIENWVDRLISREDGKGLYQSYIPENWVITETEIFITLEILGLSSSWERYTTKEIIEAWLNKLPTDSLLES